MAVSKNARHLPNIRLFVSKKQTIAENDLNVQPYENGQKIRLLHRNYWMQSIYSDNFLEGKTLCFQSPFSIQKHLNLM